MAIWAARRASTAGGIDCRIGRLVAKASGDAPVIGAVSTEADPHAHHHMGVSNFIYTSCTTICTQTSLKRFSVLSDGAR
jgi:hypothetical protein